MRFTKVQIRTAVPEDAPAIATVHVESWRTTYQGLLPDSLLSALSVAERTRSWEDLLAKPADGAVVLVACDPAGQVVGFACGGKERTGRLGCEGELYAMYLLRSVQRRGLGTELVRRLARELAAAGLCSLAVWVLARNPAARFYERLGGIPIASQEIERGGEPFVEVAYGWSDLASLCLP